MIFLRLQFTDCLAHISQISRSISDGAMHSASDVERATLACFLLNRDIKPPCCLAQNTSLIYCQRLRVSDAEGSGSDLSHLSTKTSDFWSSRTQLSSPLSNPFVKLRFSHSQNLGSFLGNSGYWIFTEIGFVRQHSLNLCSYQSFANQNQKRSIVGTIMFSCLETPFMFQLSDNNTTH